jgi:putative FmdB family regulatory protein
MPIYEYEHCGQPCGRGRIFEEMQSLRAPELTACPECGGPVRRIVSRVTYSAPHSDRELRDQGFSKLVRRDDGVYENVTAREGESRVVHRDNLNELASLKPQLGD